MPIYADLAVAEARSDLRAAKNPHSLFAGAAGLLTLILRKNLARVPHWIWVGEAKMIPEFSFANRESTQYRRPCYDL